MSSIDATSELTWAGAIAAVVGAAAGEGAAGASVPPAAGSGVVVAVALAAGTVTMLPDAGAGVPASSPPKQAATVTLNITAPASNNAATR
jgi:hypothetical protein